MAEHRIARLSLRCAGMACRYGAMTLFVLGLHAFGGDPAARAAEGANLVPPPAAEEAAPSGGALPSVVLAGGCFWGIQAVYQHVEGVHQAVSGYAGGTSVDFETVENCPRQLPASVERQQVACTREHFVTRALCL